MTVLHRYLGANLLLLATSTSASSPSSASPPAPALTPSEAAVQRNAFQIFNAVHSAFRQWGSSLNHNGMSFFLATVPEGQPLYHGTRSAERETGVSGEGFDWLAFEVEHAQQFAHSWVPGNRRRGPPGEAPGNETSSLLPAAHKGGGEEEEDGEAEAWEWLAEVTTRGQVRPRMALAGNTPGSSQAVMAGDEDNDDENKTPKLPPPWDKPSRGYFHTYRAARPLNLLYIDGMAASKVRYGCLDTQDYVLLDWPIEDGGSGDSRPGGPMHGELDRAKQLCELAEAWAVDSQDGSGRIKIDGFVRMEAGFEIIYCDFAAGGGLDLVSVRGSAMPNETSGGEIPNPSPLRNVEWLRGVALRYHGLPRQRVAVDWSSMVSAFFYDVNVTNPDASRPELPRVVEATRDERRGIRARVREVVADRLEGLAVASGRSNPSVADWQDVADMLVTRYSSRLPELARANTTAGDALRLVDSLMDIYIDYRDGDGDPAAPMVERCTRHYLEPALRLEHAWTPEDRSIYLAMETVSREICTSFLRMRQLLWNSTSGTASLDYANDYGSSEEEELQEARAAEQARQTARALMAKLRWTTWKECPTPCPSPDEVCLVAMFPWGDAEDHFSPRCKVPGSGGGDMRRNYWFMGRR